MGDVAAPTARRVYVALGSNLGDRAAHLVFARERLAALPATCIAGASTVEETAPLGLLEQGAYLNQMLALDTALAPEALLDAAQAIEGAAGRDRASGVRWGPRALDVDLVLIEGSCVATPRLTVPHVELANRDFWHRELAELGVDWRAHVAARAVRETHA